MSVSLVKVPRSSRPVRESRCRGKRVVEIPTPDVRAGDRICMWLSDAEAYPLVLGWSDRTLTLSRYGLEDTVHRSFCVDVNPWWNGDGSRSTASLSGTMFILAREVTA